MSLLLISLFSFLAATSLIIMIVMLGVAARTSPQTRIERRMMAIGRDPYASRAQIQGLLKDLPYSETPWVNALLSRLKFVRGIYILLEKANLDISVGVFLIYSFFSGVVIFLALGLFGKPFPVALVFGVIAFFGPYLYAKRLARKRLRLFLEQMPDGLDLIGQGLQAGLGLTQSLTSVAKEMPDPFGTEFSVLMEELNLGLPLTDALKNIQERIPLPELRLLSTALIVQRETGGSLAELLNKLADVIRDRFRIERQIKTITAQNRASAWVVSCTPVVIAVVMFASDPAMGSEVVHDPVGRTMLFAALILEVLGILTFRKIIRIRI